MPPRLPTFKLKPLLLLLIAAGGLAGAGALAALPHPLLGHPTVAKATPSPGPTALAASPAATAQPAVAGATHNPDPTATPATSHATAAARPSAPAGAQPQPTPAATSAVTTVTLSLIDPDGTRSYSVRLLPGANACSILEEAHSEGKISYLDIDYSYMSTLHSAYVRQINSYANNWTVTVNGTSPRGCSLVSPGPNDNVTWRYQ